MADLHLITRQRSDEDRRVVRTQLTPKGLALVDALDDELRALHRRRLAHVDKAKLQALVETLAEIRDTDA